MIEGSVYVGESLLHGRVYDSCLIDNDSGKWQKGAANYGKAKYHDIYQGIDVDYYGNVFVKGDALPEPH